MDTTLQRLDRRVVDLLARYNGQLEFEGRLFVPTRDNLAEFRDDIDGLKKAVRLLEKENPSLPQSSDVVFHHLRETLEYLDATVTDDPSFPNRFVERIIRKVNALISLDDRDEAIRVSLLEQILGSSLEVSEAAGALAVGVPTEKRTLFVNTLRNLPEFVAKILPVLRTALSATSENALQEIEQRLRYFSAKARDLAGSVESAPLPDSSEALQGLDYDQTLKQIYHVEIEELLAWYRGEVEQRRDHLYALAREYDSARDPFEILEQDLGPYHDREMILPAMEGFVDRARAKAMEHITLPPGENCAVWPVPEYLKDAYPWGGYFSGGNALLGNLKGAVFLNIYNYRTLTKGWILLNAIHECYPGHHAHFVKTAAANMPLSFKVGSSKSIPLNESICVRSETLMQDIFDEPAFRLFAAYRRLHTSVRIWADLLLHHFGEGANTAIDLYVKYMKFDPKVAQGQVYSQQLTPGYFTTYYYGLKKLTEIQGELGLTDTEFTEPVFSSGKISLEVFRQVMQLPKEVRAEMLTHFNRDSHEQMSPTA